VRTTVETTEHDYIIYSHNPSYTIKLYIIYRTGHRVFLFWRVSTYGKSEILLARFDMLLYYIVTVIAHLTRDSVCTIYIIMVTVVIIIASDKVLSMHRLAYSLIPQKVENKTCEHHSIFNYLYIIRETRALFLQRAAVVS